MATKGMPGPHGAVATVRALRDLTSDPCPALDSLAAAHGATFAVGGGPLRMVVIGDPAHLPDMFAAPTDAYRWGHRYNVLGFIVGRTSMIVSDGEDHRRRRGSVQPALARRRLDAWIPMIVDETDVAIDDAVLPTTGLLDLYPVGKHLVLTIVVQALFGAGLRDRVDEIDDLFEVLQNYLELPGPKQLPHPFPGTQRSRASAAHDRLNRLLDVEIAERRTRRNPEATDLLDALVAEADSGDPDHALTDEEIRDQVNTMIGAGYHTTAATLAWTITRALTTPGVWDSLRQEADAAFDGDPSPDTLARLPYAKAVVHESLRLHPAGVFSPRQAERDVAVGPYTVPKGTLILWSPYLAGRDEQAWPSPLEFDPDRHLDPDPEQAARMDAAWVPFGKGPRRCIGFALAQMELTLILARLAQRLDLTPATDVIPRPHGVVVNRPVGGVPVTAHPRP